MDLKEFIASVPGFAGMQHPDKILHFGWFLHTHSGRACFDQAAIRASYKSQHMQEPNLSEQFRRLLEKNPKVLLHESGGFKLEHTTRARLDEKYGDHETTIACRNF
jgi:hypothetical protein